MAVAKNEKPSHFLMAVVLLGSVVIWSHPTRSAPSDQCSQAAILAAEEYDIPAQVMLALTRTETGRNHNGQLTPWPWSLNVSGNGFWLSDRKSAEKLAKLYLDKGIESIDIGCFQINVRWHAQNFESIKDMFDPMQNALYAAKYLRKMYNNHGDWLSAVGDFHSRTLVLALEYKKKYTRILEGITENNLDHNLISPVAGLNSTLGLSELTARGSLFPLRGSARSPFLRY